MFLFFFLNYSFLSQRSGFDSLKFKGREGDGKDLKRGKEKEMKA